MTKKLKIKIGNIPLVAELLEEKAPKTCEAILDALPIEGDFLQARWSGEVGYIMMPEFEPDLSLENPTGHPAVGEIIYYPTEKEFLIAYGIAHFAGRQGRLQASLFAKVVEGSERLEEMGRKLHWEGSQRIKVTAA